MKRLLSIQDLSCVGKCSLTVALPVLAAMELECGVLPTAVLSTHTGFPNPEILPLTERMVPFAAHWREAGVHFDAAAVGYLSCPEQTQAVATVLEQLDIPLTVLDPVLGDNGRLYRGVAPGQVEALRSLCGKADVLVPNLTEAAFLAGVPLREDCDPAALHGLAGTLLSLGSKAVVITGLRRGKGIGVWGACRDGKCFSHFEPYIPRQLHGTGDLFTAVFAGALTEGRTMADAAALAAGFVRRSVARTPEVTPFGVRFEAALPWLRRHTRRRPSPIEKNC